MDQTDPTSEAKQRQREKDKEEEEELETKYTVHLPDSNLEPASLPVYIEEYALPFFIRWVFLIALHSLSKALILYAPPSEVIQQSLLHNKESEPDIEEYKVLSFLIFFLTALLTLY